LAKPNYRQQKRQKELARHARQAERLQRRTGKLEGEAEVGIATGAAGAAETPLPVSPGGTPKATP
jgi:hypothetical protein